MLDSSLPDSARRLVAEDFWDGLPQPFGGETIYVAVELANFDADQNAVAILDDYLVQKSPAVARLNYLFRPVANPPHGGPPTPGDYEFLLYGGSRTDRSVSRFALQLLADSFDEDGGVTLGEHGNGMFVLIEGDVVSCRGAPK